MDYRNIVHQINEYFHRFLGFYGRILGAEGLVSVLREGAETLPCKSLQQSC
jgi:hypothetical protein